MWSPLLPLPSQRRCCAAALSVLSELALLALVVSSCTAVLRAVLRMILHVAGVALVYSCQVGICCPYEGPSCA